MTLLSRFTAFALALFLAAAAQAQPVAGREYLVLDPPQPAPEAGKVEVIEFFYYGCPICYEAEPLISAWLARSGEQVALRRVPAVSHVEWQAFGRSYYTLEALGEIERLHWAVYDNYHFDGKDLKDEETMLKWAARNGVDAEKFREIWPSEAITEKLRVARAMLGTYRISGVPSMVVDGRYLTSARMAGNSRKMVEVVEALVERVRRERR